VRNKSVKEPETAKDILPVINSMCNIMSSMQTKLSDMLLVPKEQNKCIQGLQEEVTALREKNDQMMLDHTTMKRKMLVLRTPPTPSELSSESVFGEKTPPVKRPRIEEEKQVNCDSHDVVISLSATSNPSSKKALMAPSTKKKKYGKRMTVSDIVVELYLEKRFEGNQAAFWIQDIQVYGVAPNEQKKFDNTMELVDCDETRRKS